MDQLVEAPLSERRRGYNYTRVSRARRCWATAVRVTVVKTVVTVHVREGEARERGDEEHEAHDIYNSALPLRFRSRKRKVVKVSRLHGRLVPSQNLISKRATCMHAFCSSWGAIA